MKRSHARFIDWVLAVEEGLPARAANHLLMATLRGRDDLPAINSLDDLCQWSLQDLMRIRGIGRETALAVRQWVRERGRRLSGDAG